MECFSAVAMVVNFYALVQRLERANSYFIQSMSWCKCLGLCKHMHKDIYNGKGCKVEKGLGISELLGVPST